MHTGQPEAIQMKENEAYGRPLPGQQEIILEENIYERPLPGRQEIIVGET